MAKTYQNFAFALITGGLVALAYPPPGLWFLVWIGFIPLFFALRDGRKTFLKGLIAGTLFHAITLRWMLATDLQGSIGLGHRWIELAIMTPTWILSALAMGIWWGVFALLLRKKIYLAPAVFSLAEFLRSMGFGIFWYGKGMLLGPHWTMGNIAYALSGNAWVLKLASYGGIYAVTFLVLLVNTVLFSLVMKRRWLPVGCIVVLLLLSSLIPLPYQKNSSARKVNIALIQTERPSKLSYTPQEVLEYFNRQLRTLHEITTEHPETDIIVFPEASDFLNNLTTFIAAKDLKIYFHKLFSTPRLLVSSEHTVLQDGTPYSRVYFIDTDQGILGSYDKKLITPGGEFLPFTVEFIAHRFSGTIIGRFEGIRGIAQGQQNISHATGSSGISIGSVICSELFSPQLVRTATTDSQVILGHISNSIFKGSSAIVQQTLAASRFRAAENNKPLGVAANSGFSYILNEHGGIIAVAPNKKSQLVTGSVDISRTKTWYAKYGDWPILLISLAVFGLSLIKKNSNE